MWPKSTCKNCDKRSIGCHTTCKEYIEFREELDKIKAIKDETYRGTYNSFIFGKMSKHYYPKPTKNLSDTRSD